MAFDSRLLSGIDVLMAVVEAGSFARAAEALGMTQSGVSRAIARLEQRVGARLFHRTARAVSLTDEGRLFHDEVAPLISGIEDAATQVARASAAVRGRLRVNVDPAFGHYLLAPRLAELLATYPDLSLDVAVRDHLGDLVADGFDAAVRFGEPEPSSLRCRKVLDTRVVTCASPAYIAQRGLPRHPAELATGSHECILFRDPATGRPFGWEFHRGRKVVPVAVSGRLTVNDTQSLMGACLGGHGISQGLEFFARPMLADGRLVELLPDWAEETFPLYAFHREQSFPSAKVRAFVDFVLGFAEEQKGDDGGAEKLRGRSPKAAPARSSA